MNRPRFANGVERAFADLLDILGVEWQYEPREFVLQKDEEGKPKRAFRPDFYLPSQDLYIELSARKVNTEKNQKLRLLNQQYPEVRVLILKRADLEMMLHSIVETGF